MSAVKQGHPKGLYLLFFTEMWERFSYYGMRGILILYLTKSLIEGGLAIDDQKATLIYGFFTGFVYFTPLIGGWLADKFLGQRISITIGGITMMFGQLTLFAINTQFGMYLGLFLLIIGNGFFKPNISTLVGGLYKDGDDRRDSAFSIFYMGINLGAFLAPLIVGLLTDKLFATVDETGKIMAYGYRYGFLAAAVGMFFGQILFNMLAHKYLGELGKRPGSLNASSLDEVNPKDLNQPLSKEEKDRIKVIFIFFLFAIFFWAGFEQAGSSLSLYTDRYINRNFLGYEIPTSWFQSVNPLFIVLLAPLFSLFWTSKWGKKLTSPVKLGLGMVILGIGFFFMLVAVAERGGDVQDTAIKASLIWLVLTYLIHTIGELFLSPVGLSVVTKLSPPKLASVLMGVWLLASFAANIIGGFVASSVESMGAGNIFLYVSVFVIVCGLILITLNKKLMQMMHGVK
jgi:POT family proton-dependent oligopeptide transporter